jgi:hypothetical protein
MHGSFTLARYESEHETNSRSGGENATMRCYGWGGVSRGQEAYDRRK